MELHNRRVGSIFSCVVNGRVYVGSDDSKVYCLDAASGAFIWSYATGGDVLSSPAVVGGKVYIASFDRKVYCLDANTGAFIWSYTTGSQVVSSPAVVGGKVYIGFSSTIRFIVWMLLVALLFGATQQAAVFFVLLLRLSTEKSS